MKRTPRSVIIAAMIVVMIALAMRLCFLRVLYDGDTCVGGGIIARASADPPSVPSRRDVARVD